MITKNSLSDLEGLDTPTICNALESIIPERRNYGFTTSHLRCIRPEMPAIVGYASTAVFRGIRPGPRSQKEQKLFEGKYFDYLAKSTQPKIAVFQDGDGSRARSAAIFGEVMSEMHSALGCKGLITDGAVRDMSMMKDGFQCLYGSVAPSHIWFHMVEFDCEVNVAGMIVNSYDLIHADVHGAVVIPKQSVDDIIRVAREIEKREDKIISLCRSNEFSVEGLNKLWIGD